MRLEYRAQILPQILRLADFFPDEYAYCAKSGREGCIDVYLACFRHSLSGHSMTVTPEVLLAVVGVNTVFGVLALLAFLYTRLKLQGAGRQTSVSVREAIEGQQIFTSDQVLQILGTFKTDKARIQALEQLAAVQNKSQESATQVYGKVKGAINVVENQNV